MKPHMLFAVLIAGALFAEGCSNMPMLKWAGKDKVVNHHNEVPFRVLERKWIFNAELFSLRGVSESRSSEGNSKKSSNLQNSRTPSGESNKGEWGLSPLDFMVEVKGPHLDGSDSQVKAELGRIWADNAGLKYKYFMVFLKDGDAVQGALKVDAFLNTLEKL